MTKINEKLSLLESITQTSLSKDGINACIWCPFCRHSNKNKLKMVIHLEKNFFHCWLCDKKGSNVSYLISKISNSKVDIAKKLFKVKSRDESFHFTEKTNSFLGLDSNDIIVKENVEVPEGFDLLINAYNSHDPDARDVFRYAIKRGANKRKFWNLRLGYSLSSDFRRCLILPSIDRNGEINYYTARKIDVSTKDSFKYKNASAQKKNIIFNEININWKNPLTIVEGPLDLLKTNENATCLLGSSLTEDMSLFKEIIANKTTVNLSLDADVYNKSLRIAKLLDSYNINVNIVDTRGYDDVGEMTREEFQIALSNAKSYTEKDHLLSKIALI